MQALKVIPGHDWPIDAVTQKFAWLGRTGSGKSFGCKRFVEQMLKAGAQVLIVDTVGVWHGLRQGDHGFSIPVLGGLYGDIPLEPTAGELVAEVAVASGSSMVLDVSQMNDMQRARFLEPLGRRLFELKKASPGAMHIVLDEGQDAVPQNPLPNENMMLHEWVRIGKQGRAFGMGLSIVSQRPQEISKKALNQVECVLAFQLTGAHERKALEYWLSDKGIDTKLAQTLPGLEVGVPYVWSPQWLKIAAVTKRVLPIESADTSQTPKVGDGPRARREMKPIDLSALQQSMAIMVEQVKESDPVLLKKRVKELEAQLAKQAPVADPRFDEWLSLVRERDQELASLHDEAIAATTSMGESLDLLAGASKTLTAVLRRCKQTPVAPPETKTPRRALEPSTDKAPPARLFRGKPDASPEQALAPKRQHASDDLSRVPLPEGESAILKSALEYGERGIVGATIQIITGYSKSYVRKCVVSLVAQGYVVREGPGRIRIAASGKQLLAPLKLKPYPKGQKLIEHLIGTLPEGESKILKLVSGTKGPLPTKTIVTTTGYAPSYCRKCVVSLVGRRVLSRPSAGLVQVSAEVFS